MQNVVLVIAYKGTRYCGWQVQPGKPTVQEIIQNAGAGVFGKTPSVTGCSRTDSGVHAKGFVALISPAEGSNELPLESIPLAMNALLPDDIAVISAKAAPEGFHPRYDAKGKEYSYAVRNSRTRDPFCDDMSWLCPKRIDESLLAPLCEEFVGTKDFKAFMASGSKITDTVRTVFSFTAEREGDMIYFRVSADGFLYNMVRIMVGTVIDAALKGKTAEDIRRVIESKDRARAGRTAPAKGLCLEKVFY